MNHLWASVILLWHHFNFSYQYWLLLNDLHDLVPFKTCMDQAASEHARCKLVLHALMQNWAQQLHTSVECCDLAIRQLLVTLNFEKSANLGNTAFRIHMTNPKLLGATEWAFMIDQAVFDPAYAASD